MSAYGAGVAFLLVDPKIVLEMTAFVGAIKTGAVMFDPFFQNLTDTAAQTVTSGAAQCIRRAFGVDPRHKKGFIRVDVPDTRDEVLV